LQAQGAPAPSGTTIHGSPSPGRQHVYDLCRGNLCSDAFYAALPAFADRTLAAIEGRASPLLDGYSRHVQTFLAEAPRSRGEYALEFLLLGTLLSRYEGAAQETSPWIIELARRLAWTRERFPKAKPFVDWVRAGLACYSIAPHVGRKAAKHGGAVERLARLIGWLQSTGEFKQEALRLTNWRSYLAECKPDKATYWLRVSIEIFQEFQREADLVLGAYTRGVAGYVAREHAHLRWREDLLMCGKPAVEYHLNMFAAEVMNRGLRDDFNRTERKVVLLPACMRGAHARDCKARVNGIDGVDITCATCDPDCAVNRITRELRPCGIAVYMVPHSTGFSRWLARWENSRAGVTAVACIVNLLPGGLEIRERGIAAQCLPLDFPGCRKHWDPVGIPTVVNEPRLVQIATAETS
jgi:hypothetical protein